MRIIIIGALAQSLYNFRGDLIRQWLQQGHQVLALAGADTPEIEQRIRDLGCEFISYPISRMGVSPVDDIKTLLALRRILRQERPDKIYSYTLKPVIWGSLAARLVGGIESYALISGLGFSREASSFKQKVVLSILHTLFRVSLRQAKAVIFQNNDDRQLMQSLGLVSHAQAHVVNGSGVSLRDFKKAVLPTTPTFLLMGRLIVEKGHYQFFEAAKKVKQLYPEAKFQILGQLSDSSNAVKAADLTAWQADAVIEYLGETDDVRPFIEACSVFVLPSYYGEGLPRSILEAMAMARPIITTDNVGCRETVIEKENGLLVPTKDSAALADAFLWMLENQQRWPEMAEKSYELVKSRFDVDLINHRTCQIMGFED